MISEIICVIVLSMKTFQKEDLVICNCNPITLQSNDITSIGKVVSCEYEQPYGYYGVQFLGIENIIFIREDYLRLLG